VLDLAWLNSHFQARLRNPLDTAVVAYGPPRDQGWGKIDEVPFDFPRRRVSVLVERDRQRWLLLEMTAVNALYGAWRNWWTEWGERATLAGPMVGQQALSRSSSSRPTARSFSPALWTRQGSGTLPPASRSQLSPYVQTPDTIS
jgi:hypothetical protein